MASFFGKRDFGDPRHNYVPRVMAHEKATGTPFVPPLWVPKQFPGQVSFPVLHSDRIPGIAGVRRGKHDRRFVPAGSGYGPRPASARAKLETGPSTPSRLEASSPASAREAPSPSLSPPPPALSARDRESYRVRFDVPETPPSPSARRHARVTPRVRTNRGPSLQPEEAMRRLLRDLPDMDAYTAAGVAELVKAGFPPQAAYAVFKRTSEARAKAKREKTGEVVQKL